MSAEYYQLYKDVEILHFEFFSEGPNGKIRKIIQFQEFAPDSQIYNLGFGDWISEKNDVDDMVTTNNHDTQKYWLLLRNLLRNLSACGPMLRFLPKGVPLPEQDYIKWA